jgi:hypothetical protein
MTMFSAENKTPETATPSLSPGATFAFPHGGDKVNDWGFIRDLKRLIELRSFLLNEAINISPRDSMPQSFGPLNLLKYDPMGRAPTAEEWSALEAHTQSLFQLMTEPLRRRFLLGQIPKLLTILPIVFTVCAVFSLFAAILVQGRDLLGLSSVGMNTLPFYIFWLLSMGAIGSVAFVGMNALSVQQDATFDISNSRLLVLRVALGALFGLVLTLPFGFDSFMAFVKQIAYTDRPAPDGGMISQQALLLLLPFVLGFSTSLVILILNRLVEAVQTFFGKTAPAVQAPLPTHQLGQGQRH